MRSRGIPTNLRRAHCCVLAARSDYLAALFARAGSLQQAPRQKRSSSGNGLADPATARTEQLQQQREPEQGAEAGSMHQHENQGDPGRQQRHFEAGTSGREQRAPNNIAQEQQHSGRPEAELPTVAVSGVSAAVFEAVLQHVYMDGVPNLAPEFCSDEGAEALFDAADRYLLFTMKVAHCLYMLQLCMHLQDSVLLVASPACR